MMRETGELAHHVKVCLISVVVAIHAVAVNSPPVTRTGAIGLALQAAARPVVRPVVISMVEKIATACMTMISAAVFVYTTFFVATGLFNLMDLTDFGQ